MNCCRWQTIIVSSAKKESGIVQGWLFEIKEAKRKKGQQAGNLFHRVRGVFSRVINGIHLLPIILPNGPKVPHERL